MRKQSVLHIDNLESFKRKVLLKSCDYEYNCILDSCEENAAINENKYDFIAALGCHKLIESSHDSYKELQVFYGKNKDWVFGGITYDIKNEAAFEKSELTATIKFPNLFFFIPKTIVLVLKERPLEAVVLSVEDSFNLESIIKHENKDFKKPLFKESISKNEYIDGVKKIKQKIKEGLYYELNYCQEFKASNTVINPLQVYSKMLKNSKVPFGAFLSWKNKYLLSASPERFLKKEGLKVISQPIKGTIKRGNTKGADEVLKNELLNSEKERAENVMIVDLVRNDLAKTCKTGTIHVQELFGIYSYTYVHQMISTIVGELRSNEKLIDVIENAFPMGSMTGAPKIEVIKNIDKLEKTARGLYSGSVGYIDPLGNFDFNVIIRSLLYDSKDKNLSYHVGGAITYDSDPELEYEECLLKAKGIRALFN